MGNRNSFKSVLEKLFDAEQLLRVGIERGSMTSIERDILLEKLRASYEQLLFDRGDVHSKSGESENVRTDDKGGENQSSPQQSSKPKVKKIKQQEVVKQEQQTEDDKVEDDEPVDDSGFEIESQVDENRYEPENKIKSEQEVEVSSHSETFHVEDEPEVESTQEQESFEEKEEGNVYSEKTSTTILAEKFQGKKKSRNEMLGGGKRHVASKMQNKPIGDLTKAIGINDKFLFTKELFKGNAELYSKTIKQLNEFDDINDALIYIQENFQWDDRNEAANQLIDLVRRKLLHE